MTWLCSEVFFKWSLIDQTTMAAHTTHKDRYFNIAIKLIPTGEVFPLKKVHNDMKISELKHLAEYATGIPQHLQRLCYLDDGKVTIFSARDNSIPSAKYACFCWWTKNILMMSLIITCIMIMVAVHPILFQDSVSKMPSSSPDIISKNIYVRYLMMMSSHGNAFLIY